MPDNPFAAGAAPIPTPPRKSSVTYHEHVEQGSQTWLNLRCGKLTASEMKLIVTPTLKIASNDKERAHLYELLAQRFSKFVEPHYISDDMLRGHEDEVRARVAYEEMTGTEVREVGFITNDRWGFTIGYSPDGLVGDDGLIEAKSRRQKYQVQTLVECIMNQSVPADYLIQCQAGLLVAERQWLDFLSYSGGLPMPAIRVHPDPVVQNAIVEAAGAFEARLASKLDELHQVITSYARLVPTERVVEQEMF